LRQRGEQSHFVSGRAVGHEINRFRDEQLVSALRIYWDKVLTVLRCIAGTLKRLRFGDRVLSKRPTAMTTISTSERLSTAFYLQRPIPQAIDAVFRERPKGVN
jgi:hypothetical protein